ncbi:MAG TPA: hypothetical protein VNF24_05405 [Candidatus Acidoferrales bacterium]|nr:hypothetical protein [Candidatus Acidoferrales bacterium]
MADPGCDQRRNYRRSGGLPVALVLALLSRDWSVSGDLIATWPSLHSVEVTVTGNRIAVFTRHTTGVTVVRLTWRREPVCARLPQLCG